LSHREPNRAAELRDALHTWQRDVAARYPTPNPNFDATKPSGRAATRQLRKDGVSRMVKPD
jgi:hypothetical protein